jgi:hypothetical protein
MDNVILTFCAVFPKELLFSELYLNFYASGSSISMILCDLSAYKKNSQMLYHKESLAFL